MRNPVFLNKLNIAGILGFSLLYAFAFNTYFGTCGGEFCGLGSFLSYLYAGPVILIFDLIHSYSKWTKLFIIKLLLYLSFFIFSWIPEIVRSSVSLFRFRTINIFLVTYLRFLFLFFVLSLFAYIFNKSLFYGFQLIKGLWDNKKYSLLLRLLSLLLVPLTLIGAFLIIRFYKAPIAPNFVNTPGSQTIPQIIIKPNFDTTSADYNILGASVKNNILNVSVGYGGGCPKKEHSFKLYTNGILTLSEPPIMRVVLIHEPVIDMCKAYITKDLQFDLNSNTGKATVMHLINPSQSNEVSYELYFYQ